MADAWQKEDESAIKRRLNRRGLAKGRVLYVVSRPTLAGDHGASVQKDAAALLSLRTGKPVVYRVCTRIGLISESKAEAFLKLCLASYRLAREMGKPVQVYLEPGTERARVEKSLRGFHLAPNEALTRVQRETQGSWLQRDP